MLYSYFENYEGISEVAKKEKIDFLFSLLRLNAKNLLNQFLNDPSLLSDEEAKAALRIITKLKRQYKSLCFPKKDETKTIYDFFPNYTLTDEEKKQLLDKLLHLLSSKTQKIILIYVAKGKLTPKENSEAKDALHNLKKQYDLINSLSSLSITAGDIYSYFPDTIALSSHEKKAKIDELISSLAPNYQSLITNYFAQKLKYDPKIILANQLLNKLLLAYTNYLSSQAFISCSSVHLSSYFFDYPGLNETMKNELIEELFQALAIPDQDIIISCLNNTFKNNSKEKRRFYYLIRQLQKKYYAKITSKFNFSFYDLFKDHPLITKEEKVLIIGYLFKYLSSTDQELISLFLKNNTTSSKTIASLACYQTKYLKYLTAITANYQDIYAFFPDSLDYSKEQKIALVDYLISKLNEDEALLIKSYFNSYFKLTSLIGLKTLDLIFKLRAQYQKIIAKSTYKVVYEQDYNAFLKALSSLNIPLKANLGPVKITFYNELLKDLSTSFASSYENYLVVTLKSIYSTNPNLSFEDLLITYINQTSSYLFDQGILKL